MNKYKVVKDSNYVYIYDVFKRCLGYWERVGYISIESNKETDIIAKAKELVVKPIYFEA